jgi:GNAT superfamily N-acetyltransferase
MTERQRPQQTAEIESGGEIKISTVAALDDLYKVAEDTGIVEPLREKWDEEISREMMTMLAAYDGEEAIGRVAIRWTGAVEPAVVEEVGAVPMLYGLVVNKDRRRQKIGSRLLLEAEELVASSEGSHLLAFGVEEKNEPARAMYEKAGFEYRKVKDSDTFFTSWIFQTEQGWIVTKYFPVMLMVKDLDKDAQKPNTA